MMTITVQHHAVLIGEGRSPQIMDLFRGLKIGVPSGCLGETSNFKIINLVAIWF